MASKKVPITELAYEISFALSDYANGVNETMKKAVDKAAKQTKQEIQQNAPRKTGRYAKSWAIKANPGRVSYEKIVYSKKPGLPHLLEKGHAKRGGGRVAPRVHIAPAEKHGIETLKAEIERGISSGKA